MKHSLYDYKNVNNLEKLCFLPKTHKKLFKVPNCPVNCDTPTGKTSEFLDDYLKQVVVHTSWIRGIFKEK